MQLPCHWSLLYLVQKCISKGFFSLGSQFQSFPSIPLWLQPCKSRRRLQPVEWQFLWNPISLHAAVPTIPTCLLCSFSAAKQHPVYVYACAGLWTLWLGTCNCLKLREGETTPRWVIGSEEQSWRARRNPDILVTTISYKQLPAKVPTQLTVHSQRN